MISEVFVCYWEIYSKYDKEILILTTDSISQRVGEILEKIVFILILIRIYLFSLFWVY